MLFEPESKSLESLRVSELESLVCVDQDGQMLIPIHNYQGVCVKLSEGMQLGAVRACKIPDLVHQLTVSKPLAWSSLHENT